MDWTTAWGTVFTGLVVVFIALGLLILLVWGVGKIMESAGGNKPKAAPAPKPAPKAAVPAKPKAAPPVVSAGENMDDEVAAAITAALAVILAEEGSGKSYVVKSIRRVRPGASAWSRAGLAENVRPF